ncbi:hypothetical protein DFJ74DRAFT_111937 [Hyaloraphidium curvatum]|nr:hypothetical protein DFJ74DRAFT_111937 [Hyaloraphidium curvatum]
MRLPAVRCDADDLDFCSSCRPPQGGGGAGGGPVYDPRGHAMEVRQINTVYNCDRCGQQRAVGEPHMRCDACNTDYCVNCAPLPGGGGNWNQGGNNWNQGGGNNWNQGGGNNWNQGGNQGGGGVHPNPNPPPGMGGGNNWNQGGGSNWNQGGGGWNQGVGPFGLHAEGSSFKDNKQHTLTHSAVQAAYLCNMCNVQQGPSGRNYRCKTCGTAFCENCVNGVKNQGNWNQGGNNWNQGGNQGGGLAGLLDQLLNGGSLGNIFG